MKKIIYLLFFVSVFAITAKSQVTIGSQDAPTAGAVLELKSTNLGFLPTRVELFRPSDPRPLPAHVEGMVVYNTRVNVIDSLRAGFYYNSGSRWIHLSEDPYFTQKWFYMPSIVFDTSNPGPQPDIDLYQEFKKQLNTDGPHLKKSDGAPAPALSVVPAATDLYYYITDYDSDVFKILSISDKGKMSYEIITQASDSTFLNIVFVEK